MRRETQKSVVAAAASSHDQQRFELSDMIGLGAALRRLQAASFSLADLQNHTPCLTLPATAGVRTQSNQSGCSADQT
jgi:hypothetical protein